MKNLEPAKIVVPRGITRITYFLNHIMIPNTELITLDCAFNFRRWRLQKAFYHPDGLGRCGCSGIGMKDIFPLWQRRSQRMKERPLADIMTQRLTLSDLSVKDNGGENNREFIKPKYLSNIVVNQWKESDKSEENYGLLTMSPKKIERLESIEESVGGLKPSDIKLSDAMATSAAALSQHMGKYESAGGLSRFHTLLGLEMGTTMISDVASLHEEDRIRKVFCFFAERMFPTKRLKVKLTYTRTLLTLTGKEVVKSSRSSFDIEKRSETVSV